MSVLLTEICDPPAALAEGGVVAFLRRLSGPTVFRFSGDDPARTRAVVTLLHGNEPSGVRALHRWISEGLKPATNLVVIVASLQAALQPPLFSHRMLPGKRDLNRCFRPPFDDQEGGLAAAILDCLAASSPEAVIDVHNTSGSGPAFGVCPHWDVQHEALVSLFAPRMVISALSLGALMEISDSRCPTVTIEVGGREDEPAHELAWEGLKRFACEPAILALPGQTDWGMEVFANAVRIELQPGVSLAYGEHGGGAAVTLRPDIEHHNFGSVGVGADLGYCDQPIGQVLRAVDHQGRDRLGQLLKIESGVIRPKNTLRLFMITTNAGIAQSDCLMYAVCDVPL